MSLLVHEREHVRTLTIDRPEALNALTPDILEAAEEHQIFFTGAAVSSSATGDNPSALVEQSYADEDDGGLPLGLENTVVAVATGTASMNLVLRHMPPESGEAVKVAGLADDVAAGGFSSIGGGNDVDVDLNLTVE